MAQKSHAVTMRYAMLGNNLEVILPRSTLRNVWRSVRVLTLRLVVLYNKIKNIYGPKVAYLCMNAIRISLPLTMILHFCFFSGQKYVLRVRAKDKGSPPLTSDTIRVRIDTIDAEQTMVDLELDISLEEFNANRELFIGKISKLLGAEIRIAEVTVLTEGARRKKRETASR